MRNPTGWTSQSAGSQQRVSNQHGPALSVDSSTLLTLLDTAPAAIVAVSHDWRVRYANALGMRLSQSDSVDWSEHTLWSLLPPQLAGSAVEGMCRRAMQERRPAKLTHEMGAGEWVEVSAKPSENGLAVFIQAIHSPEKMEQDRDAEIDDFFQNANVPMKWLSRDGTIVWANPAEMEFLGYLPEEYIGRNITEFHVDRPVIDALLRRLADNESLSECKARLRHRDGSVRTVAINASAYRRNGKFIHTRCFTRDISAGEEAAPLRERLAAIVESSDDAVLSIDLQGVLQSWNRGAERIFGYTTEEALGRPVSILAAPDRGYEGSDILERIARGERIDHYRTMRRAKDGRILSVSLTVSPIRNADGVIVGASKVARDITHETRLAELREHLAAIVDSSDDAIVSTDLNGVIRSWNRSAERIFGYTVEEAIGKPVSMLAAPGREQEIPDIIRRVARGERTDNLRTERRTKGGDILPNALTVSPIWDSSGTVVGASEVARDISTQLRGEKALAKANESLRRSNADLELFAYSASHDLQEPLRMVGTYSELLKRKFGGKLGVEGDEYIGYLVSAAARMDHLLSALRIFTQISTLPAEPGAPVDANAVLTRTIEDLQSTIEEAGAHVTHDDLPHVPVHDFHLEQLFQNLIGNAIRYRSQNPPQIHFSAQKKEEGWVFSVRDNGIGIEPKYKEQIFGMFKRLHTTADYPGTGMGLAICERIVQRAGGNIWVDSEPGRGSTFYFTVPA